MLPYLREQYGNASSQYSLGTKAKQAIELARRQTAEALGAQPSEIIFTSGGSEVNSWIVRLMYEIYRGLDNHIITSSIEHHSVLNACRALELKGTIVTYLPVDASGRVSVDDVEAAIRPSTKLVTVMLANNEIGTLQPIAEIGQMLKGRGIMFHTDAVQAVGHVPVNVAALNVDFLTASAHKFNGPKGVGIMYKRSGLEIPALIFGGEQEHGKRAGTENVAGIVSAGYAITESLSAIGTDSNKLTAMVKATIEGIKAQIPSVRMNGNSDCRLPGIVNLGFDGISGESLMHLLDLKGVCVSTSSACSSGQSKPSHVLLALGQTEQQAKSAIRISYGKYNTMEEVYIVVSAVCDACLKIRDVTWIPGNT